MRDIFEDLNNIEVPILKILLQIYYIPTANVLIRSISDAECIKWL